MDKQKLKSLLIPPKTTIKQAMRKLDETAQKILFVVNKENKLLGTITDGDIRRGIIDGLGFDDNVDKVMYRDFIAVLSDMPEIEEYTKQLMLTNGVEQIPVLNDKGVIIDVILWTDAFGEKRELKPQQVFSNQVVIMAGGRGTRLDPFTKVLPKPLIPIGNKPVIELIMERFYHYGFYKFIYTLNYKKEYLKLFLKENNFPYEIDWVEEDDYLGTAGGLRLLKENIDDTFFVVNCDSLLEVNFRESMTWHKEQKAAMTIIGCHNEIKIPFGVLQMNNGRLDKILEKPVHDIIINTGVYIMEPHVISYICGGRYMDMNELIGKVAEKEKVVVYPIYSGWLDIGQLEEYRNTIQKLSNSSDSVEHG